MDTFREPTPEEAQFAVLQFMGQHLTGDLKMLESNLVSRNQTLNGMTISPENVLRSVAQAVPPSSSPQPPPVPAPVAIEPITPIALPIEQPQLIQLETINVAPAAPIKVESLPDKDQLEFNFNNNPYTVDVFEALKRIEDRLLVITDIQADIKRIEEKLDSIPVRSKKKD